MSDQPADAPTMVDLRERIERIEGSQAATVKLRAKLAGRVAEAEVKAVADAARADRLAWVALVAMVIAAGAGGVVVASALPCP